MGHTGTRAFLIAACCVLCLSGADDPAEIVRRALRINAHNEEVAQNYTYLQRLDVRALDGGGKVRHTDVKTWDVTRLEGSPYRRLIQKDDKPLPAKEEQEEQAKLRKSIESRRAETPEQRQQRLNGDAQKRKRQEEELKEIPDAFDLRLVGEETIDGEPVWVIEGTPRRGYKSKSKAAGYFLKMHGKIWVAKTDYQPVKIEAETQDNIWIGAFLVRLGKGAHVSVEYARVNNEVWLPKRVHFAGSARVLLVKGMNIATDIAFSDYKKFSTESHVVGPAN